MSNELEKKYRENVMLIYKTLTNYAYGKFDDPDIDDFIHNTVEYLLKKFNEYKNHTFEHLEATAILKIQGINIDAIRKFYAQADLVEIINPGDADHLHTGQTIHSKEVRIINKKLKNNDKILIRYKPYLRVQNLTTQTANTPSPLQIAQYKQAEEILHQLDPECQNLIRSQLFDRMTYKELADKFNKKIGTIMSGLSRCYDKLRTRAGVTINA
jgi:RNA polymerase sigma factor (sigma-70 family)